MNIKDLRNLEDLRLYLKEYFKTDEVDLFLFGSRARSDNTSFSDIDIAIYKKKDVGLKISVLRELLEESNLPYKVDIVVLNDNSKYTEIVKKEGVRWI